MHQHKNRGTRAVWIRIMAAVSVCASCSTEDLEVKDQPPQFPMAAYSGNRQRRAVVAGRVLDARGEPVPNAQLEIAVQVLQPDSTCLPSRNDDITVANAEGAFSTVIVAGGLPFDACVFVTAHKPGYKSSQTRGRSVTFRLTLEPPDTSIVVIRMSRLQ